MNDTNISPRQSLILNYISPSDGISRGELEEKLKPSYIVSKPTLIRDLDILLKLELVKIVGKGKNTKYIPLIDNLLLRPFDINRYFEMDPDNRVGAKKSFNFKVFDNLEILFYEKELAHIQSEIKSFKAETKKLSPDILKRELERFTIELSWKSSKIEGNTYSLLETETLIKDNREARGKTKEETQMILNHKDAFNQTLKNRRDFKSINMSLIIQLHNILVDKLSISSGIRKQAVGITGTVYEPFDNEYQTREAMEKFINAVNSASLVLEKALIISFMLPYIQPFADGNKRTARMLANAVLLAYDLYPLSYRNVDEDEFKKALILFYEQNSIVYIKKIFMEQLLFASKNYFK
ncbi:MAG: Fic family protein [Patescibacteria group bacterium]|nr:Fic family protein [Patescibacteria group bacterium]